LWRFWNKLNDGGKITIFDRTWYGRVLVGGMCHYMLPSRQRPPQAALCGRYGDEAMEWLLARIRKTGAPAAQFQAKLFGGSNMFETAIGGVMDIGRRNIDMA
jgi:chemotaxis protein CheD